MKKLLYLIFFAILGTNLSSCDIETSGNGKLDGNWQLLSVNYQREGGYDSLMDVKARQVFWGVQFRLVQIRVLSDSLLDDGFGEFVAHFEQSSDSLILPEIYVQFRNRDSLLPADSRHLEPIGMKGNNARFSIEELTKQTMLLQSDYAQLRFRKF